MNMVCLIGRLTRDPEVRYTQSQKPVASFTLAVDRDYKNENGDRPADFVNCVAWNNSATFLERYAKKGAKIGVVGKLQSRKWQDRDGNNRYSTEVNCSAVEIFEFAKRDSGEDEEEPRPKRERKARTQDDGPGSGYEVYSPPGFDDMDDGELPM